MRRAYCINKRGESMIDPEKIPDYEHCFFTKDGKVLRNLADLKEELKVMPPGVFNHHVNDQRNDFSNWVRDVFGHEKLADKIGNAKTRDDLFNLLDKNVALMILSDMPKPTKESLNRAKKVVAERKQPKSYSTRGHSIDRRIKGEDLKGRIIKFDKKSQYKPSPIERAAEEESIRLQKAKEAEKAKEEEKIGSPIDLVANEHIAKHVRRRHIMRHAAIAAISTAIIVLLYFAFTKTF